MTRAVRRASAEVQQTHPSEGERVRVVVVAKQSAYARYVEDENDPRVRQLLARRDPTVRNWLKAHEEHCRTLATVESALQQLGVHALVVRHPSAQFDTTDAALVITVGGDGTLLAASHNVSKVPILGINSAPRYSVGFFCAAHRRNAQSKIAQALEGTLSSVTLTRMQVTLNGRIRSRRVLNEALFCHASPAATSRYILVHDKRSEDQRSSGIWVGPAAGSTGAQRSAGGQVLPLGSKRIQLIVREPYAAFGRSYKLLRMTIGPEQELRVQSSMQDAMMFLDGPYKVVRVRLGDEIRFQASSDPLVVLGMARRGR